MFVYCNIANGMPDYISQLDHPDQKIPFLRIAGPAQGQKDRLVFADVFHAQTQAGCTVIDHRVSLSD